MSTSLQLLHLARHGCSAPFLVVVAGDFGLVTKEFVELAAAGGCVVVVGDFVHQFVEGDVAVVACWGRCCLLVLGLAFDLNWGPKISLSGVARDLGEVLVFVYGYLRLMGAVVRREALGIVMAGVAVEV